MEIIIEALSFILVLFIMVTYFVLKDWRDRKYKNNCYKCNHHNLLHSDSLGMGVTYTCAKEMYSIKMHRFSTMTHYIRCDNFEGGVEVTNNIKKLQFEIFTRREIDRILKEQGRSKAWLIKQLNMPRSTFYWKLDYGFTTSEIDRIEKVLGVEFE